MVKEAKFKPKQSSATATHVVSMAGGRIKLKAWIQKDWATQHVRVDRLGNML